MKRHLPGTITNRKPAARHFAGAQVSGVPPVRHLPGTYIAPKAEALSTN
jgi:hypothetical protein